MIPERFRQRIREAKQKQLEQLDLSNNLLVDDSQKLTIIPVSVLKLNHLKSLNLMLNNIKI